MPSNSATCHLLRETDRQTQTQTDTDTDRQRELVDALRESGGKIYSSLGFRPLLLKKGCKWMTYHITYYSYIHCYKKENNN